MNTKNSFRQFVKDGLVGVVVALIIFVLISLFILQQLISTLSEFFGFVVTMFLFPNYGGNDVFISPMPFVLLTAFISVGISGRWLGIIGPRTKWIKDSLLVGVVSAITGFAMFIIPFALIGSVTGSVSYGLLSLLIVITAGGVLGFVTGTLAGIVFNPNKRIYRILIGAIASALVAYIVGFTSLIPQSGG